MTTAWRSTTWLLLGASLILALSLGTRHGFGLFLAPMSADFGWGREVFAFTRPGDAESQAFARCLGATWAGGSDETPPEPLDAALIFAPAGALVPVTLLRHKDTPVDGTAPVLLKLVVGAQLAGLYHSPLLPPTQVADASWVTLAVVRVL